MTPLAALADPTLHAAALAWHRSRPRGRMYGDFNVMRATGTDPSELEMPEIGTCVYVSGGPRDGLRGWIWRRKDRFNAMIRTESGERISVHAKWLRVGGNLGPMPGRRPPHKRANQHGLQVGARAEIIGGLYRGRLGTIDRMAGAEQVWLLLDDGRRVAPAVRFVRVLV